MSEIKVKIFAELDAVEALAKLKQYNHPIALIGGVDAVQTLFSGTAEAVKAATIKAIEEGYAMIAPGCSIPPATPLERLKAMVEGSIACQK